MADVISPVEIQGTSKGDVKLTAIPESNSVKASGFLGISKTMTCRDVELFASQIQEVCGKSQDKCKAPDLEAAKVAKSMCQDIQLVRNM